MTVEKLLAIDTYEIYGEGIFTSMDQSVLSMLYQPIIGLEAQSLYITLWSQWSLTKKTSITLQHHHLLLTQQSALHVLKEARKKLEGIGLLQTFAHLSENDLNHYVYQLKKPLSPSAFFEDSILNLMLYERLGRRNYQERKLWFQEENKDLNDFLDVTVPFNDIFSTSEKMFALAGEIPKDEQSHSTRLNRHMVGPQIVNRTFDFELFLEGLSGAFTSREMFTNAMKSLIIKLAYVYDLNIFQMQRVVLDALDGNGQLLEKNLRKSAQKAYQNITGNIVPKIYPVSPATEEKITEPLSKEEALISYLERVSPVEFLTDFANGAKPSTGDLKIVEQVSLEQRLPNGVINVLLYYTLLKTDMKLSLPYVSKIAAHWSRKGVKTAREAMKLAKSEQWTEQKRKVTTTKKPSKSNRSNVRKEVIPTWMKEDVSNQEKNVNQIDEQALEERRKKIEAWLASGTKEKVQTKEHEK